MPLCGLNQFPSALIPRLFRTNVTRIFISLAWFAIILMAATLIVGLSVGDLHQEPSADTLRWGHVHRLSGVPRH